MKSSAQTEALATAWLARRDSGHFSAAEEAELAEWLQASTANRVAFIRLEAAWQQANRLKVLGSGVSPGHVPPPDAWRHSPYFAGLRGAAAVAEPTSCADRSHDAGLLKRSASRAVRPYTSRRVFKAMVAGLLLVLTASSAWIYWPRGPVYRTEVGVAAAVPMVDGSKVTLNTNSKVRIAVSETERRVELEQGEAFFEVASDARRPFVVSTGSLQVVATGTKFAVRREADQFRVVVTEGRVRVEKREGGREVPLAQISAGGIAYTRGDGVLMQEQPLARVEEALSWRNGFVVFHQTTLAEAVAELNRYNTRKIVIKDPAIAAIRISGNFRAANGDAFARLLEDGFPIRAELSDTRIILRSE